jgi:hypothetical protein
MMGYHDLEACKRDISYTLSVSKKLLVLLG